MDLTEYLRRIVEVWEKQIELCADAKKEQFGKTANTLWSFLGKSYRELYIQGEAEEVPFAQPRNPYYKTRISKSAEAVALLVPWVLSNVPHRMVAPRRPPLSPELAAMKPDAAALRQTIDAEDQLAAYLQQWFLNYTSREYNLKKEARTALPEAFVKGCGLLWHEMVDSPVGPIPASLFTSIDDLLIDSDTRQWRDAGFIIRRKQRSAWQLAEERDIPREKLQGVSKSSMAKATAGKGDQGETRKGNDVCVYYEIYSRVGLGHWLDGNHEQLRELGQAMDALGQHVYLEVMPGLEYPLTLPPSKLRAGMTTDELKAALQWPIPFYADTAGNPWPCSKLDFYPHQQDPWADSPLQPGLPMQIFLDHAYTFLMGRMRVTSRNILLIAQSLEAATKKAIEQGFDLELVSVTGEVGVDFDKLFKVIEFPEVNKDLWSVIPLCERAYERATGLEPLIYGAESDRQMRSAKEAGIREAHASSRPDDYADATEDWLSAAAAKEGQAARLMVDEQVVAPLFGESLPEEDDEQILGPLTEDWMRLVYTEDPYLAAAEMSYTIEAGSARRQNKQKEAADLEQIIQTLGQPLLQLAMSGLPGPFNAITNMLGEQLGRPMDEMMIPEGLRMLEEEKGKEGESK